MKRFMIAGTNSGCGKTTITCAVLSALNKRGLRPASFKCGPDYIDPMFHRSLLGVDSHNLDGFFCDDNTLKYLLAAYSDGYDVSVIEGVMGYYDGSTGSSNHLCSVTDTPAVIVIDCKGMSDSIGAVMSGFLIYKRNSIIGFIFNRLPEGLIPLAKKLCEDMGTGYFGCLPQNKHTFESRHLGLVTAQETEDIQDKLSALGGLAEQYIDIERLLSIEANEISEVKPPEVRRFPDGPTIAVAKDRAFCFLYDENIQLLEKMGCRISYFSPLEDSRLPHADGLIICGGYPELYAKELSQNTALMADIKDKLTEGMPVIAECGGFMYLHRTLKNSKGESFPMVGFIDGESFPTGRLQRFGYVTLFADEDNLLCERSAGIRSHEFHYWDSTSSGEAMQAKKTDGRSWKCAHVSNTVYAGFPHIYFYADIKIAERFVEACISYGGNNGQDR